MQSSEIRKRFLAFFEKRGHVIVPSASLVPENDSSVLFTTAGMQQFKPYYIGKADAMKDFGSLNTASIQKCVRTSDIEEVGDASHLTFFEMLGNFSFGGYFKEKAIQDAHDFITKDMGLKISYVSVFSGEEDVPADTESEEIWKKVAPHLEIKKAGKADNFWGPTGTEGPCGPTSEIYVDGIEIWNLVFNQFYQHPDKRLERLATSGVDTGMGLERLALVSQFPGQMGEKTIFDTDLFAPIMQELPAGDERARRIIADHVRAAVFMIADGVVPSNTERGYVLRRLIRRAMCHADTLEPSFAISSLLPKIHEIYGRVLSKNREHLKEIAKVMSEEESRFAITLTRGLREFEKAAQAEDGISGVDAFLLSTSHGFPFELTKELARERGIAVDEEAFREEMRHHQEISRIGAEQKFKGGLGGHSDEEVKLHTATHLLNAALKKVLGEHVKQKGSNITAERLRFDFSHGAKMTDEERMAVERFVNDAIAADHPVTRTDMPKEAVEKLGAEMEFGAKYPDMVSVYTIGDEGNPISREFCGGPHVTRTGELGTFKITKEEASSAGVRRIKATLEPV